VGVRVRAGFVPRRGLAHALAGVAAVLIRRILSGGPAAVRRLACGLGPAPSFGGPLRDEGVAGPGEPAQGGGLAGERLIVPALGRALEDAAHLGQQVGPARGKFAEFGHRGGLLVPGEVAPSGVVPGGSGELGDQEPVSSRRTAILVHRAMIERMSGYLKQAGELSRQSRSRVAVSSDIPGCQPPTGTASATCRQGTRTNESRTYLGSLSSMWLSAAPRGLEWLEVGPRNGPQGLFDPFELFR
jgi:hypothetical protein